MKYIFYHWSWKTSLFEVSLSDFNKIIKIWCQFDDEVRIMCLLKITLLYRSSGQEVSKNRHSQIEVVKDGDQIALWLPQLYMHIQEI